MSASSNAVVQEIFSAIQGEGMLVGARQLFIRLHGCHLRCDYCDTPASRAMPPLMCAVERTAGTRVMVKHANPLTVDALLAIVCRLQAEYPHQAVSLTGGEPLLHQPFLDALLPALHARGLHSLLETNGRLPEAMAALSTPPTFIAMDIKLPTLAGIPAEWERQTAFLEAAITCLLRDGTVADLLARLQIKIVFGADSLSEIDRAVALIAACRTDLPCVLQPLTPRPGSAAAPPPATVLEAQRRAARHLACVRVIPQTHVMLGQW